MDQKRRRVSETEYTSINYFSEHLKLTQYFTSTALKKKKKESDEKLFFTDEC